jgi:hypothetical protein
LDQLIDLAKEYYGDQVLDLDVWRDINKPKVSMVYYEAFYEHLSFIEELKYLLSERRRPVIANVVSTHRSKSITLPVIMFEVGKVKIYMRYNFHNWSVSVDSHYILDIREISSYAASIKTEAVYCEGFKDEWIFEKYDSNHKQFTLSLTSNYQMYTFMYLLDLAIRRVTTKRQQAHPAIGEVYTSDIDSSPIQIISIIAENYNSGTTYLHKQRVDFKVYIIDNGAITTKIMSLDEINSKYTKSDLPRLFK